MSVVDVLELRQLHANNSYHSIIENVRQTDLYSNSPEILNIYCAALFNSGQYDELPPILDHLETYLASDSNFLSLCGATYRRLGQFDRASHYLESALKLDTTNIDIQNNLANLNIDLGNYDRANSLLTKILELRPDYPNAIINLKRLRDLQNNDPGKSSSPSCEPFQLMDPLLLAFSEDEISSIFKKAKPTSDQKAHELLENVAPGKANDLASDLLSLARKYVSDGLYDKALHLCSKALVSLGPIPAVYECASDAYLGIKSFHKAEVSLLYAYILGSRSTKTLLNLISFTSMRDDYKLSNHILQQIKLTDPSNPHTTKFEDMLSKHKSSKDQPSFAFEKWSLDS